MKTFSVEINEFQRAMLLQVLQAATLRPDMVAFMASQPGQVEDSLLGEVQIMVGMLAAMPEHETAHPGLVHGLCL